MGWGAMAVAVAAAVAGAVQANKAGDDAQDLAKKNQLGTSDTGWTAGTLGNLPAPQQTQGGPPQAPRSSSTYDESPGRIRRGLGRTNDFLGSPTGKALLNIGGGFIGDFRQHRNKKKQFEYLEKKGLNAFEIAGTGAATGRAEQSSLGASGRDREHERELSIAPQQRQKLQADVRLIEAHIRRADFDLKNYWASKFANMAPANAMLSLAAFKNGVSLQRVLTAQGDATDEERRLVQLLYNDFIKIIDPVSRSALGIWQVIKQVLNIGDSITNPSDTYMKDRSDWKREVQNMSQDDYINSLSNTELVEGRR